VNGSTDYGTEGCEMSAGLRPQVMTELSYDGFGLAVHRRVGSGYHGRLSSAVVLFVSFVLETPA
jgi:hypothetical protein